MRLCFLSNHFVKKPSHNTCAIYDTRDGINVELESVLYLDRNILYLSSNSTYISRRVCYVRTFSLLIEFNEI